MGCKPSPKIPNFFKMFISITPLTNQNPILVNTNHIIEITEMQIPDELNMLGELAPKRVCIRMPHAIYAVKGTMQDILNILQPPAIIHSHEVHPS